MPRRAPAAPRARCCTARSSATRARSCPRSTPTPISESATTSRGARCRLLYRVRLGYADDAALADIESNASVVFVMNHRSNMDYVLVAYMAANRSALSYAVGEWARTWPLQTLIKSLGAYFVRRNSGNRPVSPGAGPLCAGGDRRRRRAGGIPGGRPEPRRRSAPAAPRPHQLHGLGIRSRRRARPRLRSGRHQLRPGARGPLAGACPRRACRAPKQALRRRHRGPVRRPQRRPHAAAALVSLRLRVRELRRADLDARLWGGARGRLPRARRRCPLRRRRAVRRRAPQSHRRRNPGAARIRAGDRLRPRPRSAP